MSTKRGELKYWVFEQDKLELQLKAHVEARIAAGAGETVARAEANAIREFLLSEEGKPLRGGRAG